MTLIAPEDSVGSQKDLRSFLRSLIDMWSKVFALLLFSSPRLSIAVSALTILEMVFGLSALYIFKLLIDAISNELSASSDAVQAHRVYYYLALTAGATLAGVLVQAAANYARIAQSLYVADYVDREIHSRAIQIDLAFFESPKYFDSLERARQAGSQRPAQVISGIFLLLKSSLFLGATLILIAGIDWRLGPSILLPVLVVLGVQMRFTQRMFNWRTKRIQMERRAQYIDFLMTSNSHAKEVRMGNLGPFLSKRYAGLREVIRREQLLIERHKSIAEGISASVGTMVFLGTTGFLIYRAFQGGVSIGDLILFVLLFRRAEASGREFVGQLTKLYDDQMYLRQLFDFLDTKPQITRSKKGTEAVPVKTDGPLVMENVSFQYPGNHQPTLQNINLEIRRGQIVALVGENGSGKTSLIKLIGRLYDPVSGVISVGGTDVRDFDPEEYRRHFSIIFQDYACYADTVRQNIGYGDVNRPLNETRLQQAAEKSDSTDFIKDLKDGFDTLLTRVFDDGQEISIGQWQRLALARAFYPDTDFVVMDEPTSALDPKAEFELFQNFRERLEGRSALVISHRLSTIRQADYIYVLAKGKIVEQGSHDELIAQKSQYASLFEKQGRNYR